MTHSSEPFVVAAVQGSPVFLDRKATLDKACSLITEAGAKGARLVVFPEGYLPGYPFWVWFIPSGNTKALRDLYVEILDNSVSVPDRLAFKEEFLPSELEWINPGGSAIVDPDGKWVTEPVIQSQEILYGEVDPRPPDRPLGRAQRALSR